MHDFKIVRTQGLPALHLTSIEFLGGGEVNKILVARVYGDWESGSLDVMSPFLAGGNACHKLSVVCLVVKFCLCEFPGKEGHSVKSSLVILLADACSKSI